MLGRGVEHRMVARLGEIALERGLARVQLPFVATGRNRPAELFLESLAPGQLEGAGARIFELPASIAAARVRLRFRRQAQTLPVGEARRIPGTGRRRNRTGIA